MKKIIASSVLATAALFPILMQAEDAKAANLPASMSVDQKVDIRKGATSSYPLVTSLSTGKNVTVVDEFTNANGELWYRVDLGAEKGWGLAAHFTAPQSGSIENGKMGIISGDKVNIRKGATTSYAVAAQLSKGTSVKVIDSFKNANGELWYRIEAGTATGWVIKDYVSPASEVKPPPPAVETKTVQADNTPVRKGATNSYAAVTYLAKNQQVKVIDSFTNAAGEKWFRVDLGSVKGWVAESAFSAVKPPSPSNPELPAVGSYVYSQASGIDVRKGATDSYTSAAKLTINQKVKVIDQFVHSSGDAWLRIEVSSSLMGWVRAESVSTEQSLNINLYVSVDVANLRSGPSTGHSVVGQAKKGDSLKGIATATDSSNAVWYKALTSSNQTVWVHESVVSKQQPSAPAPIGGTKIVGTRNAVLYSGATYQYKVTERLAYNSKVTILGSFVNANGEQWLNVKSSTGRTGWTPAHELVSSLNDHQYVFAKSGAVLRKGANSKYAVSSYLKANESLIVLGRLNGWLNAENSSGTRGWVLESQTSTVSSKGLYAPSVTSSGADTYLTWQKPMSFDISYSVLSSNRLKLTGGMTDVELPSGSIKGIKSVETFASGAQESVVLTFEPGYTFTLRDYKDKVSVKVIPNGLLGKKIIIDAGHGGKDTGAIGPTGLREKDVNLGTALLLKAELEKYGAIPILTRSTDIFLELSERTAIANKSDADAFISIHGDSFSSSSRGSTTYYNSTVNFNGPRSRTLGEAVQKSMVSSLGTYNRGVKEQNFYVNRMNELPSVLVELAFLSNPSEEALLKTTAFRTKAAVGITKGLEQYFNNF